LRRKKKDFKWGKERTRLFLARCTGKRFIQESVQVRVEKKGKMKQFNGEKGMNGWSLQRSSMHLE